MIGYLLSTRADLWATCTGWVLVLVVATVRLVVATVRAMR